MPEPVAEVHCGRLRWHLPRPASEPVARFLNNETHPLCTVADALAYAAAREAAAVERVRGLIEQCRDALAEELAAWDIDPPLRHVKSAHDACEAWLAAARAELERKHG